MLQEFIEGSSDPDDFRLIARDLIRTRNDDDPVWGSGGLYPGEVVAQLRDVLARLDGSVADNLVVGEAFMHRAFGQELAAWLRGGEFHPFGERTAQFKTLVDAGLAPDQAIRRSSTAFSGARAPYTERRNDRRSVIA